MQRKEHKGENGRVFVIAGSDQYVGAAYLCSMAVLRTGCDLVYVATEERVAWALNAMSPDLITIKLDFTKPGATARYLDIADVVLIGPGLGKNVHTGFVRDLLASDYPKVIDADAIRETDMKQCINAVLTPHVKEYEYIRHADLKENVVLLKGATDHIKSAARCQEVAGGNSGMTVGGTGDVLAGLVAGLMAQGMERFDAACTASHINKTIGETLYAEMGYGFLASDFLDRIPAVMKKVFK